MDKRFIGILVVIAAILIGIFVFTQHSSNGAGGTSSGTPTNHIAGKGSTGVKLVEYGDYECPVCKTYYSPVKQVEDKFDSQIYIQFRNLPLSSLHPNAFAAARAAEAASLQGKFWQMHDKLYDNQDPTGASGWVVSKDPLNNYFVGYAKSLNLDISKFKADYASSGVNDSINADVAAFRKTGQEMATPTYFLDGRFVDNGQLIDSSTGAVSLAKFEALIQKEIDAKTK